MAGTDCQDLGHHTGEEENLFDDGLNLYEAVGRKVQLAKIRRDQSQRSPPLQSVLTM